MPSPPEAQANILEDTFLDPILLLIELTGKRMLFSWKDFLIARVQYPLKYFSEKVDSTKYTCYLRLDSELKHNSLFHLL